MLWLLIGLAGFLGVHSVRIVAPAWRERRIAIMGEKPWKGLYSMVSLLFFVLIVWGFGQARQQPTLVWQPPVAMRHAGSLLLALAFVLLAATYVPRNGLRARLQHPMLLGTITWSVAHLLMSGWLHSVVLFGAFLAWAVADYASARTRPAPQAAAAPRSIVATIVTILIGLAACAAFALWLHLPLIGRAPF